MPPLTERPLRPERKSVRHYLGRRLTHGGERDDHLIEYAIILVLIVVVAVLALVFLGDAVADLVSLIGGRVDEATIVE
jgi:Flp pilus assembly pilin Flp